jgi:DNA-binding SARP family transcriptional activator
VLTVAVLGEVEVRRDGALLPLPTGKTTELLVRLALDANSPVRADVLIEDLWGEPVGRNTLQSKVSQLRRALGERGLVPGSGDAYRLVVDRGGVDAFAVVDLAAGASAARAARDAALAVDRATEGLALFRGDVLVDAGDWAYPHRVRLDELRLGLLEDLMAARVDLGSGSEVVAGLETLVERYPLREGLWASLVTALYRAGRQADALAAYSRVRTHLMEELGIEPGAGLQALERQVLQQSPALETAPTDAPLAVPGNLPALAASFVGREADVTELTSRVGQHRLVTVVGPAGVGKTRLAIEVGRRLPGALPLGARHCQARPRPVHVAGGPHQCPPPAQPRPRQRDRLELRPAVPRRPTWTVGARLLSRGCLAGRDRALDGGARCPVRLGARHDQQARRPLDGQRGRSRRRVGALPVARQHPRLRRRPPP